MIDDDTANLVGHDQVSSILYRNICAECGLAVPGSKWTKVNMNDSAKILWDFQIQTKMMIVADKLDIMLVD